MQPGADTVYSGDPGDEHQPGPTDQVQAWRLHVLIEAGYPVYLAEKIAASKADLHQAVDLVNSGCRFQTAAEILL